MTKKVFKVELTKDWLSFKCGDVLDCSRDIAALHINHLKHAKVYVKKTVRSKKTS
tara:strand:+ start:162 stop:326 length:165 start_codon:yes stop_codon:yes gene_type:complete